MGLDKAAHIHEIPYDPSLTTLNIDGAQCGVGGDLPGQGAVRAPSVSYTHLDVYKRQAPCCLRDHTQVLRNLILNFRHIRSSFADNIVCKNRRCV